jgi:methionine aminopeptidase
VVAAQRAASARYRTSGPAGPPFNSLSSATARSTAARIGSAETKLLPDDWTVVTADGALSAQFEHTVIVTAGGCEVTTSNAL